MENRKTIAIDNIHNIQFDRLEKDFSFIVNGQVYQTNTVVATILCPYISKMLNDNINVTYYEINTEYDGDFNKIIKYGEMKPTDIEEKEKEYFAAIMNKLGNNIEFPRFSKEFQENISFENVLQRIQTKIKFNINLDEEITFISSNFHNFHKKYPNAIYSLDSIIIEQIISNRNLKLSSEQELLDIVIKLYSKSKEYSILFSYIIFINLSSKSICEFIQNFDINDINNSIWQSLCHRLELDISNESILTYIESNQELFKNRYSGERYDYIIQHLNEQCHGDIQNVVQITPSSIYREDLKVENIVIKDDNSYFYTRDEANSWIQFDFKERKVLLDGYTLKMYDENWENLKNWILEGSNDGENFQEIDKHENCDLLLTGNRKAETFKVSCLTPYRFIRLTQTGPNSRNNNFLFLNQIEFSGILYS